MKKLLTMIFAVCMFASCSSDDDAPKDIKVLSGSIKQELFADETQSSEGIKFSTTGAWSSSISGVTKANNAATWLSVSPASGDAAGDYTISISLEPNTTGEDRTAQINIVCNGTTIKIVVEQKSVTDSGEKPEIKLATIRAIDVLTSDGLEEYSMQFTYDDQNRIVKWAETEAGEAMFETGATYSTDKIVLETIEYGGNGDNTNYITKMTATLNGANYVETISVRDEQGTSWEEELQTITYKDGRMVKCIEKDVANSENNLDPDETYTLVWTDDNLQQFDWSVYSERVLPKYSDRPNNKTNLDLNWLLYPSEGYAFVAGGNGGCHILAAQGYCGKRGKNLKTEESVANNGNSANIYQYDYTFDQAGCPTQIKEYEVRNGVRSLESIYIIKY